MGEGGRHLKPGSEPVEEPVPRRPERQEPAYEARRQTARTQIDWQEEPAQEQTPRRTARPPQQAYGQSQQARPRPQAQQARRQAPSEEPWRERPSRQVEVAPPDYKPRRKSRIKQNLPLIILVVILVGGVLFAGGKLASILLGYQRDRSAYNELADGAISSLAEPEETPAVEGQTGAVVEKPDVQTAPISVDWDYLQSQNSDVVGWLYSPNTVINYPVVQTTNNDYYLHRGFNQQPNGSGTLFVDPVSALGVIHSNYIIYGHNMKDGSMFASIDDYMMDSNYYQNHPCMYFLTPQGNYRVDLISGHIVESTVNNYPGFFTTDSDYQTYLNQITSTSCFYTNATVSQDYQLITLSTCNYSSSYNDPRFLLQGQLVPIQ